jgi:hypothetical protein
MSWITVKNLYSTYRIGNQVLPSYTGGIAQKDPDSKPAQANS